MSDRVVLKRGKPAPKSRRAPTAAKRPPMRRKVKSPRPWLAPTVATIFACGALGAAWLYQLPERLWLGAARGVALAGFEVRDVEVTGTREMSQLPFYTAALDGASDSMLLVDLDEVKYQVELLPWVDQASVGRVLPDRLLIDITERKPAAIWQNDGKYRLIDLDGQVLPTDHLERFTHLPLIVDDGADKHVRGLVTILAQYPAVAEHFESAVWRSGRRWDIILKSGETVMLPEGEGSVRRALDAFVRLERDTGLTGRGFRSLDFRVAKQMIVRRGDSDSDPLMTVEGTEI